MSKRTDFSYDLQACTYIGKICKASFVGRWSAGYYYSEKDSSWVAIYTRGNEERYFRKFSDEEEAIDYCKSQIEDYRIIAQRMREQGIVFGVSPDKDLEREYDKQFIKRNAEKRHQGGLQFDKSKQKIIDCEKEVNVKKKASFVDYIAYYSCRVRKAPNRREDFIWLSKEGYVIFEGRTAHDFDTYLIGCNIELLTENFNQIKVLISKYCAKKEGHDLRLHDNNELGYYSRLKNGFVNKKVDNLDSLTLDDIKTIYTEALKNGEFPNEEGIRKITERINKYLSSMGKRFEP